MLTTDPIYWQPYKPTISIQNTSGTTTYYVYNGLTDTITTGASTAKPCYCRVQLGTDHQGIFEIQFDNSSLSFDTTNIKTGQKVLVQLSKDATLTNTILLRGLIRKTTYERGIGGQALFTVAGSTEAIRMNERVTYFVQEAIKLSDGITLNINDPLMKADTLLQSILQPLGENGIWSAGALASDSDVENFIPSISIENGQLQDAINAIMEQTGAEFYFDITSQRAELKHQFQPFNSGRGFILTDTVGSADNADMTAYISPNSPPSYSESKYITDGYSSGLTSILAAEQRPSTREDLGYSSLNALGTVSTAREYCTKFRPTHSRFVAGDLYVVGAFWTALAGVAPTALVFRLCKDNGLGTAPLNVAGVVANIIFYPTNWNDPLSAAGATDANFIMVNEQYMVPSSIFLDTTKTYWLICSNDSFSANLRFTWAENTNVVTTTNSMTHTANFSTTTAGGSGWTAANKLPAFGMGRYRSALFKAHDPKAIAATGSGMTTSGGTIIESVLSNVPTTVRTKEAIWKHQATQLYRMARPVITWPTMIVSPPNIPILPNDPLMIVDNTLGYSTAGQQVRTATTGDMVYEFGERGGEGNVYKSNMYLSITPLGTATYY